MQCYSTLYDTGTGTGTHMSDMVWLRFIRWNRRWTTKLGAFIRRTRRWTTKLGAKSHNATDAEKRYAVRLIPVVYLPVCTGTVKCSHERLPFPRRPGKFLSNWG